MSVEMKTSGDPGIVNPFIFKGSGDKGDEVSSWQRTSGGDHAHDLCLRRLQIDLEVVKDVSGACADQKSRQRLAGTLTTTLRIFRPSSCQSGVRASG
jgi:hypothetical protein